MSVTEILSEAHFQREIAEAGTKLVVVDFCTTWCPPCQGIAPFFEQLPAKFPLAVFLKVDIDKCTETATIRGISVLPTFMFFRNTINIERVAGANTESLQKTVNQLYGTDGSGEDVAGHSNNSVTVSGSKMPPNKEDILRQFCDVTGADDNRSKFFLESSNWQLDVALSSFYEHGSNMEEAANTQPSSALPLLSDSDMESPPQSPGPPQKKDKKKSANPQFATLASLQQDSSSDEEGEAFYAGGSERSGQQILGPGKGRKDIISEMFKSIRERGAVAFDEETSSTSRGRGGVFGGVGYRLGQTADDHEQVTPGQPGGQQENQPRSVRLQLYREGFSVDGGTLRQYSDPDNAEFLNCIRRGEIPAELSGRGEVRLSLEDKRHDDCAHSAAPRHQAFSGKGHLLGSPTPATVGATVAVASSSDDRAANQRAAQAAVALDEGSPLTTVQFRLADGSRLTGRFNHTHTVADLIQYVSRAEPTYQLQPFTLLTSFPSNELTDHTTTLAQANLLNTTLLQRLK